MTEGDSAKSSVMSGLSVFGATFRDYYGIFPLRGKFINVRDANIQTIMENTEVKHLKTILGLQQGKEYTKANLNELRYGSLSIMTDQDGDGSHIKGLLINFLHHFWPSLLKIDGFLKTYITPIVKGHSSQGQNQMCFYTLKEYETFKEQNPNWKYKYYKGLGTSNAKEFKEYFSKMNEITIKYNWENEIDDDNIDMVFRKKRANERKLWLQVYDPSVILDYDTKIEDKKVPISEFIHKDLKHFSNYDNIRSIPNIMDGLKPGQRKVLYATLKKCKSSNEEIKVAQLAGYISEITCYHHGEVSLEQTIVGMAQNFVGSNNLNLLQPSGQFGTRIQGGKDRASSRYIFTCLNKITQHTFVKDDEPLYKYLDDDGYQIEPECYSPIVPMILMNGCEGIGTGYSTYIPCFNPIQICDSIIDKNNGLDFQDSWIPWYQGFKGCIYEQTEHDSSDCYKKFITKGIYQINDKSNMMTVTELPIGMWTQNYKEFLDEMMVIYADNKKKGTTTKIPIVDFTDKSTDEFVHFEIVFENGFLQSQTMADVESKMKLSTNLSLSNMYLYYKNEIKKFNSIYEILNLYYYDRLELYKKRKEHIIHELSNKLLFIRQKINFLEDIMSETLIVFKRNKSDIINDMESRGYIKKDNKYDYLLNLPISQWSQEQIHELQCEFESINNQITILNSKSSEQIWNEELCVWKQKYITEYKTDTKHEADIIINIGKKKKVLKK